ncbi:MAG: hypothetical protein QJR12_01280 [Mycobacterium sp.]|uniref:hypothetical protein n=1 Tax=Mycobacterium sp. TaxID=1785 RepID=UPI00260BE9CD|nr:hypothetical protein [Mycobacterium sp.]MDI3312949.1 hypothetical protein [Mycobacterium sp.]
MNGARPLLDNEVRIVSYMCTTKWVLVEAARRRVAEIAARADKQHPRVLAGDECAVFGELPACCNVIGFALTR